MTNSLRLDRVSAALATMTALLLSIQQPAAAQDTAYAVEPIAITGEEAPGTGGLAYACFERMMFARLSSTGTVAFKGSTDWSEYCTDQNGLWLGTSGNVTLVARTGDLAPEIGLPYTYIGGMQLNSTGDIVFVAHFLNPITANYHGVWVGAPGNLQPLVIDGDPAPGTGGLPFHGNGPYTLDDTGTVSIGGSFGSTTSGFGKGIWTGTPGLLDPILLTGDAAPGTDGLLFTDIFLANVTADNWVFLGTTDDPDPAVAKGIWTIGPDGVKLVTRAGDDAPGAGGRVFREFWSQNKAPPANPELPAPSQANIPLVNQSGDIVFDGYVNSFDQLNSYYDQGLWLQDGTGLRLVVLTGDFAPGTSGVPFLYFNHANFNAEGRLAFDASLGTSDAARDHGIWTGPPDNLTLLVREGDPAPGTDGETFAHLTFGPSLNDAGDVAFYGKLRESGEGGLWIARRDESLSLLARAGEFMHVGPGEYREIKSFPRLEGGAFGGPKIFNSAGQFVFQAEFTDGTSGMFLASPIMTANQPPIANAGPDQAIAENNTVSFDGSGSADPEGAILSFVWSVNGEEIATGPKVTAGPFDVGNHTVTLTVTDRSGASASDDMALTVFSNLPPLASAGPDQTVGYLQPITLDGSGSFDPDGNIVSYLWDGAGYLFTAGPNPTVNNYLSPGIYPVTLTVTDEWGATGSDSMTLTIVNEEPAADAGPDQTIQTLETVTLDGSASFDPEGRPLTFVWSMDGVQIGVGPTPIAGPFEAGIHTISLTVTDNLGATGSDELILTVQNRAPVADAGPDQTVNHAQAITLIGAGSIDPEDGILEYVWNVDGVPAATGATVDVGPLEVGVHTVTLAVTDDHGATDSDTTSITVINEAPVADAGQDWRGNHAMTVPLDGTGSTDPEDGLLSYVWTLDGVQIASGANPTVGPFPVGVYNVTLNVTDDHGATASDSMDINVSNAKPRADAGPDQEINYTKGRTTTVTLDGSASSDPEDGPLTFLWTLRDRELVGVGPTVGTDMITQLELSAGVYEFVLWVTDDHGATDGDLMVVTVTKGGNM